MKPKSPEEFQAMEQLMAELLPYCNQDEELALLELHTRLEAIKVANQKLNSSRDKLKRLQSQKTQ